MNINLHIDGLIGQVHVKGCLDNSDNRLQQRLEIEEKLVNHLLKGALNSIETLLKQTGTDHQETELPPYTDRCPNCRALILSPHQGKPHVEVKIGNLIESLHIEFP